MRYAAIGFCLLAAACAGSAPTAPTSSAGKGLSVPPIRATAGSELPYKGTLQATEAVNGTQHHLDGSGNGTQLGLFGYSADITVDEATGDGTGTVTWKAANGDVVRATTAGRIVFFDFPMIGLQETQTIRGGTGRFAEASGTIVVDRTLNLETGTTSGSFSGTLTPAH